MKLSRNFNQRKALIKTQLNALIVHGVLTTTLAKAKLIQPLFDRLIAKAKDNSLHARRQLIATLSSAPSAHRLVEVIAPLFAAKQGGFTTLSKTKIRRGDGVTLATIKLTAALPEPAKEVVKAPAKKVTTQTALPPKVKKEVKK